ncbi:hypothetical protein [Streptomyces sp. NPDC018972]|uniref:hypothetical protein n=1 Tax=Streptomyces sp. NPDC018972 TaxID=3365060 RepID=UPI0037A0E7BD
MLFAAALVGVSPSGVAAAPGPSWVDYDPGKCGYSPHHLCKGEQGPPGPPGPPGPAGPCVSIDSYNRGSQQYTGVINPDREISVGTRSLQPSPGAYTWSNLSDNQNAPTNGCSITVSEQGNTLNVQVITTTGTVVETFCSAPGNQLVCTSPWTAVNPQPPA